MEKINIATINLIDDRTFEAGKSCNGGCYRFVETFKKVTFDLFEKTYSTSSEFEYCQYKGIFNNCKDCWDRIEGPDGDLVCNAEPEIINSADLAEYLKTQEEIPGIYIEQ